MQIYLSLGTNIEPRIQYLKFAIEAVSKLVGVIEYLSSVYNTAPWGVRNQYDFLNMALCVNTPHELIKVLNIAKQIEKDAGRKDRPPWTARELDIDILIAEDVILYTSTLTVPHPHMHERRFVLVPLCEIAPQLIHPALHKTVTQMLAECPDNCEVKRVGAIIELN
ncbi:MAG: 2-amino-4-hydroxy-6-hydroxymethyldihydropteridine diphosphokinase [Chitinophagales bacterium]|nr:2-amino-4-hydroxy-6-hydroxymethyldihydropteridine diphosphokinase [Chitinophagales bacterium]